jgi:hypothetical protein
LVLLAANGIAVACAALVLAMAGGVAPAQAHESWINKGGYRSPKGEACCGEGDCFTLKDGDVSEVKGGFSVRADLDFKSPYGNPVFKFVGTVPYHEAPPSEDGQWHLCVRIENGSPIRRCFFAKPGSM